MVSEVSGIREKFQKAGVGLKETLAAIDMTLEDQLRERAARSPYGLFSGLNELIDKTVHGTVIERFRPQRGRQLFHTFEIHTEGGQVLGHLNMIYLRKPIPCYYLVYVEVLPPFRRRGLGNKIIKTFREFADMKGAVGLLDNIIPPDEPTYDIYTKLGWQPIGQLIGDSQANGEGNYMLFIPKSVRISDLGEKLRKLLFNLRKKRPVIDMHDNEAMVKRTIEEFRSVYEALERVFGAELSAGKSTPLMRFMFTKFVTKLLGFQRRIASLVGYTGGESLAQISISERIKDLDIQSYSLWGGEEEQREIWLDRVGLQDLPAELSKSSPADFFEGLPIYMRPYLSSRMQHEEAGLQRAFKISDVLELGFDPTRLREFTHRGRSLVSERLSPRFLPLMEKRRRHLLAIEERAVGRQFRQASIQINPPLAIFQDRGNVYVLRNKVAGIHLEEALDQLRTSPYLQEMNRGVGIDRTLIATVNDIKVWLSGSSDLAGPEEIEDLSFFVPWDLEKNIPGVSVDISRVSLDTLWIA